MTNTEHNLTGAGIGLRRTMMRELTQQGIPDDIDFFELAPENWIGLGGRLGRQLKEVAEQRPIVCHGLSLSIGGPAPLDEDLVQSVAKFIKQRGRVSISELAESSNKLINLTPDNDSVHAQLVSQESG